MAFRTATPTRQIKTSDGRLLAEVGYGPVRTIHRRQVAITGAPSNAHVVEPFAVRVLDGDGLTQLQPGEDIFLGLEQRQPLWRIAGDDLAVRFDRAVAERRSIIVDDSDLIARQMPDKRRPRRPDADRQPGAG
jgi:hypothetical protein